MKSNRTRLSFVLASVGGLLLLTALKAPILAPGRDPALKPLAIFTEVLNLTRSNYVEPVDVSTLLSGAYDGVTDAVDPFSYYIPEDKMARYRAFESGQAVGPGLVLGRKSGLVYVVAPVPGSPGDEAGITSGDVILSVDGVTTRNQALWEVQSELAGAEGSTVKLKILRGAGDGETEVALERRRDPIPEMSARREDGIPVVRIPWFGKETEAALRRKLEALAPGSPVILDVRESAGGDPDAAAAAASLLLPPGDVARVSGKRIPERTLRTSAARVWKGTTFVLIDSGTGGAAEIFAGALLDRSGAVLVGEPTAGMGIVQKLIPMASGGALFITVGEYRTPAGTELGGSPLKPTVRVDVFPGDTANGGDPILKRAVELAAKGGEKAAAV
jgi:carboxyl-terminal processing protease